MKFGVFNVPFALGYAQGTRAAHEVIAWDLQVTKWADEYGLSEAHFAEHYAVGGEPSPAPDLLIAAASQITKNITLGAAAHVLPYHNPVSLAHRLIWLDHMCKGRYIAGFAPGVYPFDAKLFGTDHSKHYEMMVEAADIIEAIWTKPGPWDINGKYWEAHMPAFDADWHGPHAKPFQKPHPRVAMTGMQANSGTLKLAGQRGYMPFSQQVGVPALRSHWETYSTAAIEAGHKPNRSDWRVFRDFFVAETDAKARDAVLNGAAGHYWGDILLPVFKQLGLIPLVAGPDVNPDDVTVEWMTDNFWLVGSPDTVIRKAKALNDAVGGLGGIVSFVYDYSGDAERYRRSLELLGTQVMPELRNV